MAYHQCCQSKLERRSDFPQKHGPRHLKKDVRNLEDAGSISILLGCQSKIVR